MFLVVDVSLENEKNKDVQSFTCCFFILLFDTLFLDIAGNTISEVTEASPSVIKKRFGSKFASVFGLLVDLFMKRIISPFRGK